MRIINLIGVIGFAVILAGCANIRHKAFLTSNNVMGIKCTLVDPSGSSSISPLLLFGNVHSLVATCPAGSKITVDAKTSSMIHNKDAYVFHATIDSSKSGDIKTTNDMVDYKSK
jgi:hypothetical protein